MLLLCSFQKQNNNRTLLTYRNFLWPTFWPKTSLNISSVTKFRALSSSSPAALQSATYHGTASTHRKGYPATTCCCLIAGPKAAFLSWSHPLSAAPGHFHNTWNSLAPWLPWAHSPGWRPSYFVLSASFSPVGSQASDLPLNIDIPQGMWPWPSAFPYLPAIPSWCQPLRCSFHWHQDSENSQTIGAHQTLEVRAHTPNCPFILCQYLFLEGSLPLASILARNRETLLPCCALNTPSNQTPSPAAQIVPEAATSSPVLLRCFSLGLGPEMA